MGNANEHTPTRPPPTGWAWTDKLAFVVYGVWLVCLIVLIVLHQRGY